MGQMGHQCSQAPGRPISHLSLSSRRPWQGTVFVYVIEYPTRAVRPVPRFCRPRRAILLENLDTKGAQSSKARPGPQVESQASGPNSTSTGVGVLTSVLNLSLPFDGWMRKTAMLSVFWLAA